MKTWDSIMVCVVMAGMIQLWIAASRMAKVGPVRVLHHVEVLSKDSDRVYTVQVPSAYNPGIIDQAVTVKLCPYGDDLPLKRGMIMEPFQYHQQLDCLLIDGTTFVDYVRDRNKNVVDKFGNQLFSE